MGRGSIFILLGMAKVCLNLLKRSNYHLPSSARHPKGCSSPSCCVSGQRTKSNYRYIYSCEHVPGYGAMPGSGPWQPMFKAKGPLHYHYSNYVYMMSSKYSLSFAVNSARCTKCFIKAVQAIATTYIMCTCVHVRRCRLACC